MNFVEIQAPNGVLYLTAPTIGARHCFTTRIGGVSEGYLKGLNLGENRGDVPERVIENYRLLGEATGIDTAHMAYTRQVHGNVVRVVGDADVRELFTPIPYDADGIVTNQKGLTLICYTADCVPVLLCDDVHGVIAAVHCGWRSSVADILKNAVAEMCALGAVAENISAAIGPAISYCCFEVGREVVDAVETYLNGDTAGLYTAKDNGKYLLDLKRANARRLQQLGLQKENIAVSDDCTMCRYEKYWSHRYTKGERGSQAALITL